MLDTSQLLANIPSLRDQVYHQAYPLAMPLEILMNTPSIAANEQGVKPRGSALLGMRGGNFNWIRLVGNKYLGLEGTVLRANIPTLYQTDCISLLWVS